MGHSQALSSLLVGAQIPPASALISGKGSVPRLRGSCMESEGASKRKREERKSERERVTLHRPG